MFTILINGKKKEFESPISIIDIIKCIDNSLTEECIAGKLNKKELVDVTDIINESSELSIITINSNIGLRIVRHSCAHILGHAIKKLWPDVKMVKESVTSYGFYYDIESERSFTKYDLENIENKMKDLIKKNYFIHKKKVTWEEARNIFLKRKEIYKVNMLDKNKNHNEIFNVYYNEEYVDICQGPHVPSTKFCNNFKLQKISNILFWKGKRKEKILQRIYGTVWRNIKELHSHTKEIEKLKNPDHRKIGKLLDLYHFQKESPGIIFWHHNGWIIFQKLQSFMREKLKKYKYQEVKGPFMMEKKLWEKTGHWDNYAKNMFTISSENQEFCVIPMNCPGHVQIFNQKLRSYRDLPLRIAEFGNCYRNEPSGSLYGLMRVRSFTQDDAHIFCTKEQIYQEITNCIKMTYEVYNIFNFKKILVKLSTRPIKRIGTEEYWDLAEKHLIFSLQENNIPFKQQKGKGAFYGPKIEFELIDSFNRTWQCGTIQLDFLLSKNLNAYYIDSCNEKKPVIIIHRAIFGSIERFIGILTEEYKGLYPIWLTPIQVIIFNISKNHESYSIRIKKILEKYKIRVKIDLRNKKIEFKIREASLKKIPYMLIIGNREIETNTISVRNYSKKNLESMDIDHFIEKIRTEIRNYVSLQ